LAHPSSSREGWTISARIDRQDKEFAAMTDIDAALARLRDMPVPAGLSAIDAPVLAALADRPAGSARASASMLGIAAAVAMTIGMAGSLLPSTPAHASAAFGAPPALAPSSLLGGDE
jgi:hypothetical protein